MLTSYSFSKCRFVTFDKLLSLCSQPRKVTTFLLFVSVSWASKDSTYNQNHTIFVSFGLISFNRMPSRFLYVVVNERISFFLMTNIHVCLCVCVFVSEIILIYSSHDRHLGCFHILTTVTKAVIHVGM